MDEERTLDLTNLYGFARLYKTLVQDGGGKRSTSDNQTAAGTETVPWL